MNIYGQFPYADTTKTNLDWILRTVKELQDAIGKIDLSAIPENDAETVKAIQSIGFCGGNIYSQFPYADTTKTNLDWILTAVHNLDTYVSGLDLSIDSEISATSERPVQNKVVKAYVDNSIKNHKIDVDSVMSTESTNPVQNKVVNSFVNTKVPETTTEGAFLRHVGGKNAWVSLVNTDTEGR